MGYWKNKMEEDWGRGYRDSDLSICSKHIHDDVLLASTADTAMKGECDLCGGRRREVFDLTAVVEVVARTLFEYWNDVDNEGIPWDSGEGGYQGHVLTVDDAFATTFEEEISEEPELWANILSCFYTDSTVCQRNYWELTGADALKFDWKEFTDTIKYRTRYVFLAELREVDAVGRSDERRPTADEMLAKLAELLERHGCFHEMPAGTPWHRARVHGPTAPPLAGADLATAPQRFATTPNRMSPAGIPMFYGAADDLTALAEVWTAGTRWRVATTGVFRTTESMLVVDLTRLPTLPSIFDTARRSERDELLFLRAFIDDLRQPVTRDGREHIDYVPTQVVTEYFRRVVRHAGRGFGGLLFRSTRDPRSTCSVIFASHAECLPPAGPWAGLERQLLAFDDQSATVHADVVARVARLRRNVARRSYWPWT